MQPAPYQHFLLPNLPCSRSLFSLFANPCHSDFLLTRPWVISFFLPSLFLHPSPWLRSPKPCLPTLPPGPLQPMSLLMPSCPSKRLSTPSLISVPPPLYIHLPVFSVSSPTPLLFLTYGRESNLARECCTALYDLSWPLRTEPQPLGGCHENSHRKSREIIKISKIHPLFLRYLRVDYRGTFLGTK